MAKPIVIDISSALQCLCDDCNYSEALFKIVDMVAKQSGSHAQRAKDGTTLLPGKSSGLSREEAASVFISLAQDSALTKKEIDTILCVWGLIEGSQAFSEKTERRLYYLNELDKYEPIFVKGVPYAQMDNAQKIVKANNQLSKENRACDKISRFFGKLPDPIGYIEKAAAKHVVKKANAKEGYAIKYPSFLIATEQQKSVENEKTEQIVHIARMEALHEGIYQELKSLHDIFRIDPAKASFAYATGMELYNLREYNRAAEKFREAVPIQEKLTGAGSIDVARTYVMLGLSESYSAELNNNAVTDLIGALKIFEVLGDPLYIAWCNHYLSVMFFERGYNHLNLAFEYSLKCKKAADTYYPEQIRFGEAKWHGTLLRAPQKCHDPEKIYKAIQYHDLLSENGNLLGKIHMRSNHPDNALFCFNTSLQTCYDWNILRHELVRCFKDGYRSDDEKIKKYASQIDPSDSNQNCIMVAIYDYSDTKVSDKVKYVLPVSNSSISATLLSNRAMSEFALHRYDEAITDCKLALQIWGKFSYSKMENVSYAYMYLALALIGKHTGDNGAVTAFSPEDQKEINHYLDCAVSCDIEMYGKRHPRTAYSLETRANAHFIFEDLNKASKDYILAYHIYKDHEDDVAAQNIKKNLMQLYDIEHSDKDGFNKWMKDLL